MSLRGPRRRPGGALQMPAAGRLRRAAVLLGGFALGAAAGLVLGLAGRPSSGARPPDRVGH
jgi:hypothetical protein